MKKLTLLACAAAFASPFGAIPSSSVEAHHSGKHAGSVIATGMASFYGARFAGRKTASGEIFRPSMMTAAHRTLRFGTKLRVTNLRNGKSVIVRINDRGPFAKRRIIDLSKAAARKIGMVQSGTARVRLRRIK